MLLLQWLRRRIRWLVFGRRPSDLSSENMGRLRSSLTREDEAVARWLIGDGQKIKAIGVVLERTGVTLKEAKAIVDEMQAEQTRQ